MKKTRFIFAILLLVLPFTVRGQSTTADQLFVKHNLQYYRPKLFFCVNATQSYQELATLRRIVNYIETEKMNVYPVFVFGNMRDPEIPDFFRTAFGVTDLRKYIIVNDQELFELLSPEKHTDVCYIDGAGIQQSIPLFNTPFEKITEQLDIFKNFDYYNRTAAFDETVSYIDRNAYFQSSGNNTVVYNFNQEKIATYDSIGKLIGTVPIDYGYEDMLLNKVWGGSKAKLDSSAMLYYTLNKVGLTKNIFRGIYANDEHLFFFVWHKYPEWGAPNLENPLDTNVTIKGFSSFTRYDPGNGSWQHYYIEWNPVFDQGYEIKNVVFAGGDSLLLSINPYNPNEANTRQYAVFRVHNNEAKFDYFFMHPQMPADTLHSSDKWLFRNIAGHMVALHKLTARWVDLTSGEVYDLKIPKAEGFRVVDFSYSPTTQKYYVLTSDKIYHVLYPFTYINEASDKTIFFHKTMMDKSQVQLTGDLMIIYHLDKKQAIFSQRRIGE